ncbi:calcium-binding protein [Muricoccus radiodurans]|uniref:calcium-binding protein n=1 Tax=Muricoccus radiodurans TaxID=2231721 RepID=UPI003CF83B00
MHHDHGRKTSACGGLEQGAGGPDTLFGWLGDDQLFGGVGDDLLVTLAGADSLDGGHGIDTLRFTDTADGVEVNLATGRGGGAAAEQTDTGIERVEATVYDAVTGDEADNTLLGGEGNDTIRGAGRAMLRSTAEPACTTLWTTAITGTTAGRDGLLRTTSSWT